MLHFRVLSYLIELQIDRNQGRVEHEIRKGLDEVERAVQVLEGRKGVEATEIFEFSEVNAELDQVAPTSPQVSQRLNLGVVNVQMLEFGQCMGIIQGRIVKGGIVGNLWRRVTVFVQMIKEVAGVQVGQFGDVDEYGFVLEEFF